MMYDVDQKYEIIFHRVIYDYSTIPPLSSVVVLHLWGCFFPEHFTYLTFTVDDATAKRPVNPQIWSRITGVNMIRYDTNYFLGIYF